MKAIHRSRIDGVILLALAIGILCGIALGKYSLIGFVPLAVIWFIDYDINSHEHKKKTDSPASHNQSSH